MITVPVEAVKDPAFGNKRCTLHGRITVVYDEEFGVAHAVDDENGNLGQFDNDLAVRTFLMLQGAP